MLEILEIKFLSSKNWCKMPEICIWVQKSMCYTRIWEKNLEKLYTVATRKLLFLCHFFFTMVRQMEDFLNLLDLFYPSGKDPIGRV